jgi:hypothetical protein
LHKHSWIVACLTERTVILGHDPINPTGGTTMKSLVDHLSQYAAYHRDPRNIASHFIGIPLIVVAVASFVVTAGMVAGRFVDFSGG